MDQISLYPLRFEPSYQYRLWGGRRLAKLISAPLGMLMEPESGNPQEIEDVLNPAATRVPDGKLYLFPRLVAKGNYSRIGIARDGIPNVASTVKAVPVAHPEAAIIR
jgi:hypothetical protein